MDDQKQRGISESEIAKRRFAMLSALGSQRIAGVEPDASVLANSERWVRGEITISEAIENYKAQFKNEVTE